MTWEMLNVSKYPLRYTTNSDGESFIAATSMAAFLKHVAASFDRKAVLLAEADAADIEIAAICGAEHMARQLADSITLFNLEPEA